LVLRAINRLQAAERFLRWGIENLEVVKTNVRDVFFDVPRLWTREELGQATAILGHGQS
jgi:hypothetical protein